MPQWLDSKLVNFRENWWIDYIQKRKVEEIWDVSERNIGLII